MKKINGKKIWKGIKTVGSIMVGVGATAVVGSIVKSNTAGLLHNYEKPCVAVTTFLAGCMLGDKLVEYVEDQICDVAVEIKKARDEKVKEFQNEVKN